MCGAFVYICVCVCVGGAVVCAWMYVCVCVVYKADDI